MNTKLVVLSSQSILLPLIVSYNYNDKLGIMLLSMLYLTSVIFWNNPIQGLVRCLDITLVQLVLWIGLYRSQYCNITYLHTIYVTLNVIAMVSFTRGLVIYHKNKSLYIIYHMLLHIFGSASAVSNTICYFHNRLS